MYAIWVLFSLAKISCKSKGVSVSGKVGGLAVVDTGERVGGADSTVVLSVVYSLDSLDSVVSLSGTESSVLSLVVVSISESSFISEPIISEP